MIENVAFFAASDNGEKMLYRQNAPGGSEAAAVDGAPVGLWTIASTTPAPAGPGANAPAGGARPGTQALRLEAMAVRIDPLAKPKFSEGGHARVVEQEDRATHGGR